MATKYVQGKSGKTYAVKYVDSVIDGLKVTQANTQNRRTGAVLKGNKLLIKWGKAATPASKKSYLPKVVKWAKGQLVKKKERIQQRKDWTRTKIQGFSVYDIEGKQEVVDILAKVKREVQPILRKFGLKFTTMKESVAEGTLGFNRGRRIIALNVRQRADPMKIRKYSAIMRTMIHELAHLKHMDHSRAFYDFDEELLAFARKKGIYKPR